MWNLVARSALVSVILLATTMPGQTTEPLTPANTALSDAAIEQRIDFIEQRLDSHETHGQIWYWSWMAINGGSMVGLGISAGLSKHENDQINNGVQAGLGAIGVADLLLRPLEARYGADPIRGLPEGTHEEKIAKLRAAESQLHSNAQRAQDRTSWEMHAGNVAVNGIAGLIIGLAGRPSDRIIAFGAGTAGGVIEILTQPWGPPATGRTTNSSSGDRRCAPTLRSLCGGACQRRRPGRRPLAVVSAFPARSPNHRPAASMAVHRGEHRADSSNAFAPLRRSRERFPAPALAHGFWARTFPTLVLSL